MITGVHEVVSGAVSDVVSDAVSDVHAAVRKAQSRREQLREQTDHKIMKATLAIVISDGVGAVTIEEVARRSGVAKTTIYRRYKNADDLLRRVQLEVAGLPDFSDVELSKNGLLTILQRIQDCFFDSELGLKAVGVVLSSDNPSLNAIADQVLVPAEKRFSEFVDRGVRAGVFRHGLDPQFLFSTILGSMLACKALHGDASIPWPENMTAVLWPVMAA